MTIYLPNEPAAFREAFSNACDRIIASTLDRVFYHLCAALIEALQASPLVSPYFLAFEKNAEQLSIEQDYEKKTGRIKKFLPICVR